MILKTKTEANLPKGFFDQSSSVLQLTKKIIENIRKVYEIYGFEEIETPYIEYTDVLGKFLPNNNQYHSDIFSFKDDHNHSLSLRYDLTAPLARYVAKNFDNLPNPYRSYRLGWVFRNEKPGPGRFCQFLQFDADIIGVENVAADAEVCMMVCDVLENLGISKQNFKIKINNRKMLDGILQKIGISSSENNQKKIDILRALDKFEKFGTQGVSSLLGKGRMDSSGDFTKGMNLDSISIRYLLDYISLSKFNGTTHEIFSSFRKIIGKSNIGLEGISELEKMYEIFSISGYQDCIKIDPSIVRGLEYYTGPIFEIEYPIDKNSKNYFGSIGGGGRYNNLISRFRKSQVPATGFSIGISRLISILIDFKKYNLKRNTGPVVILAINKEKDAVIHYHEILKKLRTNEIRSELYIGDSKIKGQMKYADKKNSPCLIIQGEKERLNGIVRIKDLIKGSLLSKSITDNITWRKNNPAQKTVKEEFIIQEIKYILSLYNKN